MAPHERLATAVSGHAAITAAVDDHIKAAYERHEAAVEAARDHAVPLEG
jgi:hypothetical protein